MAHFNLYKADEDYYMRIIDVRKDTVWDTSAGAFAADTTWAHSVIALTFSDVIGAYPVTLPTALPVGTFDLLFYKAEVPADSDTIVVSKRVKWNGSNLGYAISQILEIE